MQSIRKVTEDILWVGCNDRRITLFENLFPVPKGVSYNSYLLIDEKVALMDTVDESVTGQFLENLEGALEGRAIDYLIVHHMEPGPLRKYPASDGEISPDAGMGSAKAIQMIGTVLRYRDEGRTMTVKEGDTLSVGSIPFVWLWRLWSIGRRLW